MDLVSYFSQGMEKTVIETKHRCSFTVITLSLTDDWTHNKLTIYIHWHGQNEHEVQNEHENGEKGDLSDLNMASLLV